MVGRIGFVVCLLAVMVILGYFAHELLSDKEIEAAEARFVAAGDRAMSRVIETLDKKRLAVMTVASIYSELNPDAAEWPFIKSQSYATRLGNNVNQIADGRAFAFVPFVERDQIEAFNEFAYAHFDELGFKEGTGVVGEPGPWFECNCTEGDFYAPVLAHPIPEHPVLMLNIYIFGDIGTGPILDNLLDCHERVTADGTVPDDYDCNSVSDSIFLFRGEEFPSPGAFVTHPIYPANNRSQVRNMGKFDASCLCYTDRILIQIMFGLAARRCHHVRYHLPSDS